MKVTIQLATKVPANKILIRRSDPLQQYLYSVNIDAANDM